MNAEQYIVALRALLAQAERAARNVREDPHFDTLDSSWNATIAAANARVGALKEALALAGLVRAS